MSKIVFVLIDGLDTASTVHMAYLAAHKENGALCGIINCELPTVSKPIYSSMFTGKPPLETAVTHNKSNFMQAEAYAQSFFVKMNKNNKICAMVAYYWMRELFCNEIYDKDKHRLSLNQAGPIHHGVFYDDDFYPDRYVFQDAEFLRINYNPNFLLVHSMGVDAAGHGFGVKSTQYRNAVRNVDVLLAEYVPKWRSNGATVIITSDHGMHADGAHNDTSSDVRAVPYWILGDLAANMAVPSRQTDWYKLLLNIYNC